MAPPAAGAKRGSCAARRGKWLCKSCLGRVSPRSTSRTSCAATVAAWPRARCTEAPPMPTLG
eukprot:6878035-Pyramimonas_sp.AAC.1